MFVFPFSSSQPTECSLPVSKHRAVFSSGGRRCWTQWFDRDNGQTGEQESVSLLEALGVASSESERF